MKRLLLAACALSFAAYGLEVEVEQLAPGERVQITEHLYAGQSLNTGDSLISPNHQYVLTVQADGNVVLWGPSGVLWSSWFGKANITSPAGYGQKRITSLVMQTDGNLVGYGPDGTWSSETWGFGGSNRVSMQNDGNLVVYQGSRALWATYQGNFVRWDNQLQGCFAKMNDPYQGFCISGNNVKMMVSDGYPVPFRCGTLSPLKVYQNALEGKIFAYVPDFYGNPVNTNSSLCEPVSNVPPIFVAPQWSNQQIPILYLASPSQASNNNASVTFDGVWTAKFGQLRRVASIPGL